MGPAVSTALVACGTKHAADSVVGVLLDGRGLWLPPRYQPHAGNGSGMGMGMGGNAPSFWLLAMSRVTHALAQIESDHAKLHEPLEPAPDFAAGLVRCWREVCAFLRHVGQMRGNQ